MLTVIFVFINITLIKARPIVKTSRATIKNYKKNEVDQTKVLTDKLKRTELRIVSYFWSFFNV